MAIKFGVHNALLDLKLNQRQSANPNAFASGRPAWICASDECKDREGVERMTQMSEHVVAWAVNHAGLEHGVVKTGGARTISSAANFDS